MTQPGDEQSDPYAPPTAPMQPVPPAPPSSSPPASPSYDPPPAPPSYEPPAAPAYNPPPTPPAYEPPPAPPAAPTYEPPPAYEPPAPSYQPPPSYEPPATPTYEPPTAPAYQPPAPTYQPPTVPAYPATPTAPPYGEYPGGSLPPAGYTVPATYGAVPGGVNPGVGGDPLVLPPGSPFGAWFSKVQEIGKRSWKSALLVAGLGVAVPNAIIALINALLGFGSGFGVSTLGTRATFTDIGAIFGTLAITYILLLVGYFVASIGWGGGIYALTMEASGQPVTIGQAFSYGSKQLFKLGSWYVLVLIISVLGICACFVGAIYLSFALSLFSFVVVYERGQNPISRSFKLTHANFGPTLGKVAILAVAAFVYNLIIGLIFGAIEAAVSVGAGVTGGSFGVLFVFGILQAIASVLAAPVYALLLIGLLPTYAELRAREAPLSTPQLRAEISA